MNFEDRERDKHRRRREEHVTRQEDQQFRQDVQDLMRNPAMRRVMNAFLFAMAVDGTPFNTNAMAQSHAIGRQDAARWWLNHIRDHCPEQEVTMRMEANAAARDRLRLINRGGDETEQDDTE